MIEVTNSSQPLESNSPDKSVGKERTGPDDNSEQIDINPYKKSSVDESEKIAKPIPVPEESYTNNNIKIEQESHQQDDTKPIRKSKSPNAIPAKGLDVQNEEAMNFIPTDENDVRDQEFENSGLNVQRHNHFKAEILASNNGNTSHSQK